MTLNDILGEDPLVFIGLTVILAGSAGYMTGQALAATWRPFWHALPYAFLMAAANRFLAFALFGEDLGSLSGFVAGFLVIFALAGAGFRLTRVAKMVSQYPWLYERAGFFSWRPKKA